MCACNLTQTLTSERPCKKCIYRYQCQRMFLRFLYIFTLTSYRMIILYVYRTLYTIFVRDLSMPWMFIKYIYNFFANEIHLQIFVTNQSNKNYGKHMCCERCSKSRRMGLSNESDRKNTIKSKSFH